MKSSRNTLLKESCQTTISRSISNIYYGRLLQIIQWLERFSLVLLILTFNNFRLNGVPLLIVHFLSTASANTGPLPASVAFHFASIVAILRLAIILQPLALKYVLLERKTEINSFNQVERWINKASDESENVNWLLSNTKRCPQCRAPIEKNGGCMHMVCQKNSGGCGYEFCWLCRGDWSEHGRHTGGYYNCNKYEKSDAKKDDDSSLDIKTELEHYMFYYHRYQSHQSARVSAKTQSINHNNSNFCFLNRKLQSNRRKNSTRKP
jgi:hypothetical protein